MKQSQVLNDYSINKPEIGKLNQHEAVITSRLLWSSVGEAVYLKFKLHGGGVKKDNYQVVLKY